MELTLRAEGLRVLLRRPRQRAFCAFRLSLFVKRPGHRGRVTSSICAPAPAIRPFRWSRLFWTHLLPAMPLAVLFDGIVSCLRT